MAVNCWINPFSAGPEASPRAAILPPLSTTAALRMRTIDQRHRACAVLTNDSARRHSRHGLGVQGNVVSMITTIIVITIMLIIIVTTTTVIIVIIITTIIISCIMLKHSVCAVQDISRIRIILARSLLVAKLWCVHLNATGLQSVSNLSAHCRS